MGWCKDIFVWYENLPWVIGGDFNMVLSHFKRFFKSTFKVCTTKVKGLVTSNLIDLPLYNGQLMWSNMRDNTSLSRIDRFLFFPDLRTWLHISFRKFFLGWLWIIILVAINWLVLFGGLFRIGLETNGSRWKVFDVWFDHSGKSLTWQFC